jgi:hypothetical protein
MRKAINIITLLVLIWLVLDAFHVPDAIVGFLLIGAIPGSNISLSPSMMLAIMTSISGIIVFELLARRFGILRQIRYYFLNFTKKQERLPKRRFGRV